MSSPVVSIVTSTYNRSNVLRLAIESALAQTFTDWEMLVIGDACTDDTEAVVRSFEDPRLSFVNLPVNTGDQSIPNSEGARMARGRYIALLNHDDLWLPRHLSVCLEAIEGGGIDFVWTLNLAIQRDGSPILLGASESGRFDPFLVAVPASGWMFRREIFEAAGPWTPAGRLHMPPSQEWLFRVWKQGARMLGIEQVTVISIQSGSREGSYSRRLVDENAECARLLRDDPDFIQRLMTRALVKGAAGDARPRVIRHLVSAAKNLIKRLVIAAGIHPLTAAYAIRHRRRGGFIDSLRRRRGLPPLQGHGEKNV